MATSPNGNGGWYISLKKAGLTEVLEKNGIEWLNVFAVDNVLQRIADPVFIGATIEKHCAVGYKVEERQLLMRRLALCVLKMESLPLLSIMNLLKR